MGIKDLHPLLKKACPNYSQQRHLSEFAFQKVAIDISLYLYKYKALAKSTFSLEEEESSGESDVKITNHWICMFLDLICCLRAADIHPLFVYDGPAPADKLIEQQRRRSSLVTQKDKIDRLEGELKEYLDSAQVDPANPKVGTEIAKFSTPVSLFHPNLLGISVEAVKEKIRKMKSMTDIAPTPEDIQLTKQLFDLLQIPYIVPPDEAERYAAQLCVVGKIDAVLSEDTDVLAYGTPIFLTKIDVRSGIVYSIENDLLLREIEMTQPQFQDMCILLGCDYNSNIYGYGWNKTLKLIQEHVTIEKVIEVIQSDNAAKGKEPVDVSVVRYERCRELFAVPDGIDLKYPPYCGVISDFSGVEEFLFVNNIRYPGGMDKIRRDLGPRKLVF